jgi:hypothetical protein
MERAFTPMEHFCTHQPVNAASSGTDSLSAHLGYMGHKELFDEATKIQAVDGEVQLDGPDGVDVALTPEAAEETADRMFRASAEAAGQRKLKGYPHQPE